MPELPSRLQVGTSFEQAMPLFNTVFNELDSENRTKIIYNGNVPQVLFGYQKGGFVDSLGNSVDYGLKVSRIDQVTGIPYDVTTATDEQLQFTTAVDTRLMYNQHVPQLLFGYQNGGFGGQSYGMKVSKIDPGTGKPYDVRIASDAQLAYSTGFDTLQVIKSDVVSVAMSGTGASGLITIPHNLGYPPTANVTVLMNEDATLIGDFFEPLPLRVGNSFFARWVVDSTNLYLLAETSVSEAWPYPEATFRYEILRQTAATS